MTEPGVYLEKLSAFSRILRMEGLAVSTKETEDAGRLLIALGLANREQVKTALRTVYAKSREEQLSFDRAFDGFFLSEEAMRRQAKEAMEREKELQQHQQEAQEELQLSGKPMDLSDEQRQTYAAMPEEARQRLRNFMEKYRGTAERNPQLYSEFIHSVFAKTLMEQQMLLENAGAGAQALDPESFPPKGEPEAIRESWISGEPSGRDWKPAAASTGCATGKSGPIGGIWCCCATFPAPWCSFPSLPSGLSRA